MTGWCRASTTCLPSDNPKEDQKVADAWKNGDGKYRDFYELAKAFDMTHKEVKDTIGRVRFHKKNRRNNRAE